VKGKLVTRTAEIRTASKKRGNYGFATTLAYEPTDFLEMDHGSLYIALEVLGDTKEGDEVAGLVTNVVQTEYYADLNREPLASFEAALQRLNEELAELASSGRMSWVGKLSAVIGVFSGRTLHLTQIGSAHAFLLRGSKMTDISKDLSDKGELNPLKTFLNIASGTMLTGDRLVFTTESLLLSSSEKELSKLLLELSPARTLDRLRPTLEQDSGLERLAAILIEVTTEDALSKQYVETEPSEVIIDRTKGMGAMVAGAAPTVAAKVSQTAAGADKSKQVLTSGAKGLGTAGAGLLERWRKRTTPVEVEEPEPELEEEPVSPPEVAEEPETIELEAASEEIEVDTEPKPEFEPRIEAVEDELDAPDEEQKPVLKDKLTSSARVAALKSRETAKRLAQKKPQVKLPAAPGILRRIGGKSVSLILVVLLAVSIGAFWNVHSADAKAKKETAAITQTTSQEKDIQTALSSGNKAKAGTLITQALSTLKPALDSKNSSRKSQADSLRSQLQADQDQIDNVVRLTSPASMGDFGATGKAVETAGLTIGADGALYTTDKKTGSIYKLIDGTASVAQGETSNPSIGIATEDDGSLATLLSGGGLAELAGNTYTKPALSIGNWPKSVDFASFTNYIYLLDPSAGRVWKVPKTVGGFGKAQDYIGNENDQIIKGATSIAIDGNVYILQKDGTIWKFNQGVRDPFKLSGLPSPIPANSKLFTGENVSHLYALDPGHGRIVMLGTDGTYVRSYVSSQFQGASGIYVSDGDKDLFVLSGNKVFQIPLS
jgi:hypothetical protein